MGIERVSRWAEYLQERSRQGGKDCGQHHGQQKENYPGDQRHASRYQKAGAGKHGPEEESWK